MEKLKHKAGLRVAERMMILKLHYISIYTTIYFKKLYVALSRLVLI